jgi:hypothetical protein
MIQAITKRIEPVWLRRLLIVAVLVVGSFVIYVLSIGPVLRFFGASPAQGWNGVPSFVRFIYAPLTHVPEPFATYLDHYVDWWIDVPECYRN